MKERKLTVQTAIGPISRRTARDYTHVVVHKHKNKTASASWHSTHRLALQELQKRRERAAFLQANCGYESELEPTVYEIVYDEAPATSSAPREASQAEG